MKLLNTKQLLLATVVLGVSVLAACQTSESDNRKQASEEAAQAAKAEENFQKSMDRAPTPDTLFAMARIVSAQHRDAECEQLLVRIMTDYPNYMPAYNELAELQIRQRKIEAAIDTLNKGLKHSPNQGVLLNNIGMCHLLKGQNEEALADFTRAAGVAPDDTRFRANMATALGMMGRYDEAISLYLQVGTAVDAHYNLGVVASARKDRARADQEFALAKALEANGGKEVEKKTPPAE